MLNMNVNFNQNQIDIFNNHMQELKIRIDENKKLGIIYEKWMDKEVSSKSMVLSKKFLEIIFPGKKLSKIEIFLIATHIELAQKNNSSN